MKNENDKEFDFSYLTEEQFQIAYIILNKHSYSLDDFLDYLDSCDSEDILVVNDFLKSQVFNNDL